VEDGESGRQPNGGSGVPCCGEVGGQVEGAARGERQSDRAGRNRGCDSHPVAASGEHGGGKQYGRQEQRRRQAQRMFERLADS